MHGSSTVRVFDRYDDRSDCGTLSGVVAVGSRERAARGRNVYRDNVPSKICRPDTEMVGPSRAARTFCLRDTERGFTGLEPGLRI